jgi:peptidoglycan/xylan/chitin deacetylase (PgdA/CDA1 family)
VACIWHGQKLPSRAALITFDDGYLDNYTNAYPILKARNLPAIIFLATDYIGIDKPFYWDLVAYCFHHTTRDCVDLPIIGERSWVDDLSRTRVMLAWIDTLKKVPDTDKQKAVARLPDILGVSVGEDAFRGLTISWSQAREMNANGIGMGGHTVSHPILTRIPLDDVTLEVSRSKQRIEDELKTRVFSFAYPNGQLTDFNRAIMTRVEQVGYKAAFTLLSGPTRHTTVANQPFSIRRIFLSHEDNFSRFIAKLTGLPRIIQRW